MKKCLSLLLSFLLMISLIPSGIVAFAVQEDEADDPGEESEAAPMGIIDDQKGTAAYIRAKKTVDGATPADEEVFSFELLDEEWNVVQTAQNSGETIAFEPIRVEFDPIRDDLSKPVIYYLRETEEENQNYIYDTTIWTVKVSKTKHEPDEPDHALIEYCPNGGSPLDEAFFNNQKNTSGIEVPDYKGMLACFTATKTIDGAIPSTDEVFSFELLDEEWNVLQTVQNSGETITFEPVRVEFDPNDLGKILTYYIREKNDGKPGYTYDTTVYTVKVSTTESDESKGEGTAKVWYYRDDVEVETAVFNNPKLTYGFKLHKIDNNSSETLHGAVFELKDSDGMDLSFDFDEETHTYTYNPDGEVTKITAYTNPLTTVKGLAPGTYKLVEIDPPLGYARLNDKITVNIEEEKDANGNLTGNAIFSVTDSSYAVIAYETDPKDETKCEERDKVTDDDDTKVNGLWTHVEIRNLKGVSMPSTGSDSALICMIVGFLILAGYASYTLLYSQSRKREEMG